MIQGSATDTISGRVNFGPHGPEVDATHTRRAEDDGTLVPDRSFTVAVLIGSAAAG